MAHVALTVSVGIPPCDHIQLTGTVNGRTETIVTTRAALESDEDRADDIRAVVRHIAKRERAAGKTWAQVKAAVEAEGVYL